jgi:hypothetical protein
VGAGSCEPAYHWDCTSHASYSVPDPCASQPMHTRSVREAHVCGERHQARGLAKELRERRRARHARVWALHRHVRLQTRLRQGIKSADRIERDKEWVREREREDVMANVDVGDDVLLYVLGELLPVLGRPNLRRVTAQQ